MKAILNYWDTKNVSVTNANGFRYSTPVTAIMREEVIEDDTEIKLFEHFYSLNNSLRYCNGCYYTFKDDKLAEKYQDWLHSDDYKSKSFELYYGNGIVD